MGECERECVPELVFCYEHADREAMKMVIVSSKKEISRLRARIKALVDSERPVLQSDLKNLLESEQNSC
jgi:hypothetical protein